jgi:hypothetical protein
MGGTYDSTSAKCIVFAGNSTSYALAQTACSNITGAGIRTYFSRLITDIDDYLWQYLLAQYRNRFNTESWWIGMSKSF